MVIMKKLVFSFFFFPYIYWKTCPVIIIISQRSKTSFVMTRCFFL